MGTGGGGRTLARRVVYGASGDATPSECATAGCAGVACSSGGGSVDLAVADSRRVGCRRMARVPGGALVLLFVRKVIIRTYLVRWLWGSRSAVLVEAE